MAANREKKGFQFPSAYTILFALLVVIVIATWIIPAGQYDKNEKGNPIPGTYHRVKQNPQDLIEDTLLAPVLGMYGLKGEDGSIDLDHTGTLYGAINIALYILVIGGFLFVAMETGAIDAGIGRITTRFKGRERLMIVALMIIFALGGTSYGMSEETLAFYGLIITVMLTAGYDVIVGVAVVMLGAGIGVLASTVNPFATGTASNFAGISIANGLPSRLFILVVGVALGIFFVVRYAEKVKKDPTQSLVRDQWEDDKRHFLHSAKDKAVPELTGRRKVILALFFLTFLLMIYGSIPWGDFGIPLPDWGWSFGEFSSLFLGGAILIGIVGRLGEKGISETFINGARDMLGVALIVAVARGISVVMTNGLIIDTVLNWAEQLLDGVSGPVFINFTHLLYLPLGFLIPSSSGLATVSMPIMTPLAGIAGVNPSLVVTAFQSASGLLNLVNPTFAVVMGGLALGRVRYDKWLRFVFPLLIALFILYAVVLTVGSFFPGSVIF